MPQEPSPAGSSFPILSSANAGRRGSASLWLPEFPYLIPLIWQFFFATCQKQEIGFDLDYDL